MAESAPTTEQLLEHTEWLTRLARALVGDAAAGDLVQDTYEAVLAKPANPRGAVRPWLGGVARNVARMAHRGRVRREHREHVAPLPDEIPSPEQLLARAQVQQKVNRLVVELPEPLRSTLLLRFFEGMSAAEISRAQGIPAGTVRSRLKDALDRLRAELDAEHDNNRAVWAGLLAPLPGLGTAASTSTTAGGAIASTHAIAWIVITIVVAVLVVGGTRVAGLWGDDASGTATQIAATATTSPTFVSGRPAPARVAGASAHELPTIVDDDPKGTLRLEGQVIDEHDAPVVNAMVAIDTNPPRVVETESDGAFVFDGLIHRDYRIESTAGERYAGPVRLRLTDLPEPITLRMHPGGRAEVTVTERAGGAPIEGAEVELRSALTWKATTDARGIAKLTGLGAGSIPLVVRAPGFAPAAMMMNTTGNPASLDRTALSLARGASLAGRVVDDRGSPIANARVVATSASEVLTVTHPPRDGVVSDADGSFSFPTLSAGTWRVTASAGAYAPTTTPPIAVDGEHARTGIELQMHPGAVLRGIVRDVTGASVPAAEVSVVVHGYVWWRTRREAFTDAKGTFSIRGLEPRAVDVVAWHDHGASSIEAVDLATDRDRQVALTLDERGAIAGTVVDQRGRPLGDAQVIATPDLSAETSLVDRAAWSVRGMQEAVTDQRGGFRLAGLPDGSYTLRAARPGAPESTIWLSSGVAAKPNAAPIRIVVPVDGRVVGKVQLADDKPATAFSIALGGTNPLPVVTTDGSFAVPAAAGTYALTIAGPGFVTTRTDVTIGEGRDTDVGTIVVHPGRSISGRVFDEHGLPVAGAMVAAGALLSGSGGQLYIKSESVAAKDTVTDVDGRYVLAGLPPASVTVVAGVASARSASVQLPGEPDSVVLDLVLAATSGIEGTVTRDGRPLADTMIIASPIGAMWSTFFVTAGPDGRFALDTLAPGDYVVYPMLGRGARLGSLYMRRVEVSLGRRAKVEIDATPGPVTLAVSVTTDAGAPLPTGQVGATELAIHPQTAEELRDGSQMPSDRIVQMIGSGIRDGVGSIDGLRPGIHTVCAMIGDARVASSVKLECKHMTLTSASSQRVSIIVPAAWL